MHKVSLKRNCPNCGIQISFEQKNLAIPPKEVSVTCTHCKFTAEYTPVITRYIDSIDNKGLKCDPLFCLPLWLQASVKGHLFWAYNREHLEEIRRYVEAELRERTSTYLMTMTARLPLFIKTAKNRRDILKVIDSLLKK